MANVAIIMLMMFMMMAMMGGGAYFVLMQQPPPQQSQFEKDLIAQQNAAALAQSPVVDPKATTKKEETKEESNEAETPEAPVEEEAPVVEEEPVVPEGTSMTDYLGGDGGEETSFECPKKTFITQLSGRAGNYIDAIAARCSGGASQSNIGGGGGSPWSTGAVAKGFNKIKVRYGDVVAALEPYASSTGKSLGRKGSERGTPATLECPAKTRIYGFNVRSGKYLDKIQFKCR